MHIKKNHFNHAKKYHSALSDQVKLLGTLFADILKVFVRCSLLLIKSREKLGNSKSESQYHVKFVNTILIGSTICVYTILIKVFAWTDITLKAFM